MTDRQKCIEEIIRQTELLKEEAIGLKIINWIKIQNINTRFRYLSTVGLLFGMKYGNLEIHEYNKKNHEEIILDFFSKADEAGVPPLDVLRYWRYINDTNDIKFETIIPPLLINFDTNEVSLGYQECKVDKSNILKFDNNSIPLKNIILYNPNNERIMIENENGVEAPLTIELYQNDTLETLRIRYAIDNNIPLEMVTISVKKDDVYERESVISGVNIKYISMLDWVYNELEDKKIIINSVIDIIERTEIKVSSIVKDIDKLASVLNVELNINKDDGYYIYLLIKY